MSSITNQQGAIDELNNQEALSIFEENCLRFSKICEEEKSEYVKINYLLNLDKLAQNLKIDSNTFIEFIFDKILFKNINILKNRNLLYNFISICQKKSSELYEKKFFQLLLLFSADYNQNSIYFHQYLIDISLEIFFNSNYTSQEKSDYISYIIESDIKPFETQFFKNIINKNKNLIDTENKKELVKILFDKYISMNKYKSCLILFMKILEHSKNGKNIQNDLLFSIIKTTNNIGFNHVIKKTKEINDFLIFNCLLLDNLDEKLFISETSETNVNIFDLYLVNLINVLAVKKDLNVDIMKKVFIYYKTHKYKILNKVFPDVIYFLSIYSYSNNQFTFLYNEICNSNEFDLLYEYLLIKHLTSLNKMPNNINELNYKTKKFKFEVISTPNSDNEEELVKNSIDNNLLKIGQSISNIGFLTHLNLFNLIIKSCLDLEKGKLINIKFYPKKLNRTLLLLSNISIENLNKKFYDDLLIFILDFVSLIIDFYLLNEEKKKVIFNENYLFVSILKVIDKSSLEQQASIIFPSLINIIKNSLQIKNSINELNQLIFDYLIKNFSINKYNNILTFKSLVILFFSDEDNSAKNKDDLFSMDKLVDLVIKSNDNSLFDSYYKLCGELHKSSNEIFKKLSSYSLNKCSKLYNNTSPLSDSFLNYIIEKFKELFIQKRPNVIVFDDFTYFIINTVSNIYKKEKPTQLSQLISEYCVSNNCVTIIDTLFKNIEINECDIMNLMKGETIYENYSSLKMAINNLDYFTYIKDYYFDNDIQDNKTTMCLYGILISLAQLYSEYLSNSIKINTTELINGKDNEKLMLLMDYIKDKILFNQSLQNTSYTVMFLNVILSNKYIYHYFNVHYTNITVTKIMKENNIDKIHLMQLTLQETMNKNSSLVNYIQQNSYYIILMKDLIENCLEYDSLILNPSNTYYTTDNGSEKYDEFKNLNVDNKNIHPGLKSNKINSFFSKIFVNEIFENNSPLLLFNDNQIFFLFLLDSNILSNYLKIFGNLFNFDYLLIQLYSIIRKKECPKEYNEKFSQFIKEYLDIDNVFSFITKIISNNKTLIHLLKLENISSNYIKDLFEIMESIIKNLLTHNNISIVCKILNELVSYLSYITNKANLNEMNDNKSEKITLLNEEIFLVGKLLDLVTGDILNKIHSNDSNENIQHKANIDIEQIKIALDNICNNTIISYIKCFYDILSYIFDEKNNLFEFSLENIFSSFYLILDFISNEELNIIGNIKNDIDLSDFINNNLYLKSKEINTSLIETMTKNYTNVNELNRKFIDYLFIFLLINGKNDEKNIKNCILYLLDEKFIENYDIKKFGYICLYFLFLNKKDNIYSTNKNKGIVKNTSILFGDLTIYTNIGERFKENEKNLQKK